MIQSLDVISVNLWQILISLANLLIIFLIVKKFLFKPVKNMMDKRQDEINKEYSEANSFKADAKKAKEEYEEQLKTAKDEADGILKDATENAGKRSEKIIEEAKEKADAILKRAEQEAELERKKAEDGIKKEIVNVSAVLTEKMLEREINIDDHHALIDSFIEKIGDSDGGNE